MSSVAGYVLTLILNNLVYIIWALWAGCNLRALNWHFRIWGVLFSMSFVGNAMSPDSDTTQLVQVLLVSLLGLGLGWAIALWARPKDVASEMAA